MSIETVKKEAAKYRNPARPEKKSEKIQNPVTAFASDLHPRLNASTENVFFSPYSLETAMGMCLVGAKGDTNKSLASLLKSPPSLKSQTELFGQLISEVEGDGSEREYELRSVNALWPHSGDGFELRPAYLKLMDEEFHSSVESVDYINGANDAVAKINDWCDKSTNGKIKTIIQKDFINKETRLILTNAIYFKGKWKQEFDKKLTRPEEFRGAKKTVKTPTMHKEVEDSLYYENDSYKALSLAYKGDELSMVILLPHGDSTEEIDQNLETAYEEARANLHYEEKVRVSLPKFKFETKYELKDNFVKMGAGLAFSDDADFTGISDTRLKISQVIHKAFVEVDEEGTEAAAVTAVGMMRCTSVRMPVQPKEFKADHPFVFFIVNNQSGNIHFCGRVSNV